MNVEITAPINLFFKWNQEDLIGAEEWLPGKTYNVRYSYNLDDKTPEFHINSAYPFDLTSAISYSNHPTGRGEGYIEFKTGPCVWNYSFPFIFTGGKGEYSDSFSGRIEDHLCNLYLRWALVENPYSMGGCIAFPPRLVFNVFTWSNDPTSYPERTSMLNGTLTIDFDLTLLVQDGLPEDTSNLNGRPFKIDWYDSVLYDESPTRGKGSINFADCFEPMAGKEVKFNVTIKDGIGYLNFNWYLWDLCYSYLSDFGPGGVSDVLEETFYASYLSACNAAKFTSFDGGTRILNEVSITTHVPELLTNDSETCWLYVKED